MDPHAQQQLQIADALAAQGRLAEAEGAYRQALALDPKLDQARFNLAQILTLLDRPRDALALTEILPASSPHLPAGEMARAMALGALGRGEEALPLYRRGARRDPGSVVWTHNLARGLVQTHRHEDAERAARAAIKLGAGEAWILLGSALQGQGRLEDAEEAFRAHLAHAPLDASAHRALSTVIWQRTGSVDAMNAPLQAAIERSPQSLDLWLERARNLADIGEARAAYEALAPARMRAGAHQVLEINAAVFALQFNSALALTHARAALNLAPDSLEIIKIATEAFLANGEVAAAGQQLARALPHHLTDQYLWGLQAIVWRLIGDERYHVLQDYPALVRAYELPTPKGWRNLSAYLADLKAALRRLHGAKAAPLDQTLRNGSQTQRELTHIDDQAIRAFFIALRAPLAEYRAAIGHGPDPLRARNHGETQIAGSWSVRLQPQGFHVSHVHTQGWISSAFYVDLPPAIGGGDHQGWIKFGEPGRPTRPALEADHYIQPSPGRLVLFPSYMWHGTVPFGGDRPRLTLAFDVVPGEQTG